MSISRRYLILLGLFFGWVVVENVLKGWWPAWKSQIGIVGTGVIGVLGIAILRTLKRDLGPTPAELALREAEALVRAENVRLRKLQQEAEAAFEEEQRQRRNARRRERRAELRAQKLQAELARKERHKPKAPPVPAPPKSRWERLLDDDE